jgi:hypothetical protein
VAKIDVTANQQLGTRFNIKVRFGVSIGDIGYVWEGPSSRVKRPLPLQYFPAIKFLHQGEVYDYEGKRDLDSFLAFVRVSNPCTCPSCPALPCHARPGQARSRRLLAPVARTYDYPHSPTSGNIVIHSSQGGFKDAKGGAVPPPPTILTALKNQRESPHTPHPFCGRCLEA